MEKLDDDRADGTSHNIEDPTRHRARDMVQLGEPDSKPIHDVLTLATGSKCRVPWGSELPAFLFEKIAKKVGAEADLGSAIEAECLAAVCEHNDHWCVPHSPLCRDGGHIDIVDTAPADIGQVALCQREIKGFVKLLVSKLGDAMLLCSRDRDDKNPDAFLLFFFCKLFMYDCVCIVVVCDERNTLVPNVECLGGIRETFCDVYAKLTEEACSGFGGQDVFKTE